MKRGDERRARGLSILYLNTNNLYTLGNMYEINHTVNVTVLIL
jgi:hypothetical protein